MQRNFDYPSETETEKMTDTRIDGQRIGASKITHCVIEIKFFIILHITAKIYVFTYEHYRIGQDSKKENTILITKCTPRDEERMRFCSYTSHVQRPATMTVNKN